jgi:hypothetical protein
VIIGLREATKQGVVTFDWAPVLDLLRVAATRSESSDESGRALRISVARLLAAGFANGAGEIPSSARSQVWEIIRPIAMPEAPLKAPGKKEAEPAGSEDPGVPGQVRRSVAADGLQAVVRYALWVRRQIEGQPGGRQLAQTGWEQIPEVREVLEAHLAPGRAATPEVQAVFGQWFPWLLMLDPAWAAGHRGAVFPAEATLDHLRQAAWDSYLAVSPVFDQVFELLSSDYERAASSIVADDGLTRPQQGLAEHLVALYLRGRVPLEKPDSLLAGFFEKASSFQRAHALAWVGQMVQSQQDRIPHEVIRRLQELWPSRRTIPMPMPRSWPSSAPGSLRASSTARGRSPSSWRC